MLSIACSGRGGLREREACSPQPSLLSCCCCCWFALSSLASLSQMLLLQGVHCPRAKLSRELAWPQEARGLI